MKSFGDSVGCVTVWIRIRSVSWFAHRNHAGRLGDLRSAHGAELADSPFEEFHHTPDVRRPRGRDGRYGIAKLGFHLYRLKATRLDDVTPQPGPLAGTFTFDPSGRDVPLFIRRHRTDDRERFDWEEWISAKEWEVPSPMRCRVLNHAEFVITEQVLAAIRPILTSPPISLSVANANIILGVVTQIPSQAHTERGTTVSDFNCAIGYTSVDGRTPKSSRLESAAGQRDD